MPPRGGPRRATVARQFAAIGATNAAREEDQQVAFAMAHIRANPRDAVDFARLVQNDQLRLLLGGKRLSQLWNSLLVTSTALTKHRFDL